MIELALDQVAAPVDPVHDLEVAAALVAAHLLQEAHERVGLAPVADGVERRQGERRVPQPHEAVVPVPHSADGLGQRGRRRGDDGAGLRVGEQLEGERRALDHAAVRPAVPHAGRPPRQKAAVMSSLRALS